MAAVGIKCISCTGGSVGSSKVDIINKKRQSHVYYMIMIIVIIIFTNIMSGCDGISSAKYLERHNNTVNIFMFFCYWSMGLSRNTYYGTNINQHK